MKTISDFIKEPFAGKKEHLIQKAYRINYVLEKLEPEKDPAIFSYLLEIIKQVLVDLEAAESEREDFILDAEKSGNQKVLFLDRLFSMLFKRFKAEEKQRSQIRELITGFILDISSNFFIKILVYCIVEDIQKDKYDVGDVYLILKDKFIDVLIDLATQKSADIVKDPFDEFLARRKIAGLLINLKDASSGRLRKLLSRTGEDVSVPLIELIGYLQIHDLADLLQPFTHHIDRTMRIATIHSLYEIGGERSIEILSKIVKEEQDSDIRDLANIRLQKLKKKTPPQR